MGFLKQPKNCRFSNKTILLFVLPIFLEQIMIAFIGIADTYMVSSFGEAAVAGVSLVTSIDKFVKSIFTGLAAGASVVVSQYIGADDKLNASKSMKAGIQILFLLTIIITAIMVIFKKKVLSLLFGAVESDVMQSSIKYFSVTAFSYPFVSLFSIGCSSYRAMGNSRTTFYSSMLMLSINLLLKYIFIYHLNLGVTGAGLSSLIAYGIVGIVLICSLHSTNNKVWLSRIYVYEGTKKMIKSIFGIGIPNGIENGMFQMGHLLLQNLMSTLGTVAIAANALYSNLSPLYHSLNSGFSLGITTFVAQCMGAGRPDEARYYMRHILKLTYVFTATNGIILILFSKPLISIYGLSQEVTSVGHKLLLMYVTGAIFAYPSSFTLANGLRGTGDTKFTMTVSLCSMFGIRIGLAYIAVYVFKMGIYGVQLIMIFEWFEKGIIYHIRERRGKWQNIKVI
ncbi:MAG: MATE family efflux transporter [Clostridia bacterium]|nr:MATE family efflux transporter [Clostridia bacterium]MBO7288921.1 MATE family efflux transporter [Clostridia bacterium]